MKQVFKTLFSILICMPLVSGCNMIDFSEDCFYTGDVKVRFDWQYLLKGDGKPDTMQTIFYPDNNSKASFLLTEDTLLTGLAATHHEVLSFNGPKGLSFQETDCPCTAYARMDTYIKEGRTFVNNVPAFYAANKEIQIPAFESTECILTPKPCFQQVYIDFIIIRENIDIPIESLSGELSGVMTKYNLQDMKGILSEASLPFGCVEQETDNWSAGLRVFGMNPKEKGRKKISNKLEVNLSLSKQMEYDSSIDLTNVFENFTSPEIYLKLEIRLSAAGISVSIADWHTGEGGNIEL